MLRPKNEGLVTFWNQDRDRGSFGEILALGLDGAVADFSGRDQDDENLPRGRESRRAHFTQALGSPTGQTRAPSHAYRYALCDKNLRPGRASRRLRVSAAQATTSLLWITRWIEDATPQPQCRSQATESPTNPVQTLSEPRLSRCQGLHLAIGVWVGCVDSRRDSLARRKGVLAPYTTPHRRPCGPGGQSHDLREPCNRGLRATLRNVEGCMGGPMALLHSNRHQE